MSTALAFDTLKLVDALEKVDLPRAQARAIVEVVRESRNITLAEQSTIAQDASARAIAELDNKTDKALALLRKDMDTRFTQTDQAIALLRKDTETRFTQTDQAIALLRKDTETGFALAHQEMDTRFAQFHNEMDTRFAQLHNEMDTRFAAVDARFTQTDNAIAQLRKEMDTRFVSLESKFKLQMDALQNKLLIKLSLVMVGLVGLLVTAQRFFPPG